MKRIYYTLFVILYRICSKMGENELPQFVSISVMSICVGFNITSILTSFEIKYFPSFRNEKDYIFLLLMYIINYFIFIYKKRYINILGAYSERVAKWRVLGTITVIIYILLSFGIWIWLGAEVRALNVAG